MQSNSDPTCILDCRTLTILVDFSAFVLDPYSISSVFIFITLFVSISITAFSILAATAVSTLVEIGVASPCMCIIGRLSIIRITIDVFDFTPILVIE